MFVAKMVTRYPDYHGSGYYNFLMKHDEQELEKLIEEYSHDFQHDGTIFIKINKHDELMQKYPTKDDLNKAVFNA